MQTKIILTKLLERLWQDYYGRVTHANSYKKLIEERNGKVVNDHIALRSLNTNIVTQAPGIKGLEFIFTSLGYERKTHYKFPSKHLTAYHYEHKNDDNLPKIFISQLEIDQLSEESQKMIRDTVKNHKVMLSKENTELLESLEERNLNDRETTSLVNDLVSFFDRPWTKPYKDIVEAVNKESQYAAWVLLHGNSVNHFTAFINKQDVKSLPDIETTLEVLKEREVPLKKNIEGERNSKLRQSSTEAVIEDVAVLDENDEVIMLSWSYAYYEFAERGNIINDEGEEILFQGFLGEQATNLFEMTKIAK